MSQTPPNVKIIKPDFALKRKIGKSLSYIFTPERIRAAQIVFDQGKENLLLECLEHVQALRNLCNNSNPKSIPLGEVIRLVLNIKGSGAMSGYPITTAISDVLHQLLSEIDVIDEKVLFMIETTADAVTAVFAERRISPSDTTSVAVIAEMRKNMGDYLAAKR